MIDYNNLTLGLISKDMDKIDRSWLVNFVSNSQMNILSAKSTSISQKSLRKENQKHTASMLTVSKHHATLGGAIT